MTVKRQLRDAAYRAVWGAGPVWRHVANAVPARRHRRDRPGLEPEAARCLADLRRDGVATTSLEALTGSPDLLVRLQEYSAALEAMQQRGLQEQQEKVSRGELVVDNKKVFVVQLLGSTRPVIEPTGVLAEAALQPQLRGIADEYFRLATKVCDINIWRSLPSASAPVSSQLWHRDVAEDRIVLKAFISLEPVTSGAGPFRYALGTQPGGVHRIDAPASYDGLNYRVPDGPAAEQLATREKVFLGPAGTVVIADTLGFHRGGWATTATRLVVQVRYSSAAATPNTRLGTPASLSHQELKTWQHRLSYDPRTVAAPLLPQTVGSTSVAAP